MPKPGIHAPLLSSHLLWPVLVFIGVSLALYLSGADLWVADRLYRWEGNTWSFKDAWLTSQLIHEDGRMLVGLMILGVLALFALTWVFPAWHQHRRGLSYLVVSSLSAALVINVLKGLTHIDCPWDLLRYGGAYPYASILDFNTPSANHGACFPAGHASAAYAWFGLYYLAREYRPGWRHPVLFGVVLLGLVFGIGQELRGAHFISHDWWTLCLCWFVATAFYFLFFPAPATSAAPALAPGLVASEG